MALAAMVDWTQVLIVGVPAYIAAVFAGLATVIVARNRRDLKTPSGDRIGRVVERTHDITHTTNALVRQVNGLPEGPPEAAAASDA